MPLILTGFKHAGKTTVAEAYATKYQVRCYDLDHIIYAQFQEKGSVLWKQQQKMHALEFWVLSRILDQPGVIALGGATILDPYNRHLLGSLQHVVYLYRSMEDIESRLERFGYPSTFNHKAFKQEFIKRDQLYRQVSRLLVDVSCLSVDTICERLWGLTALENFLLTRHGENPTERRLEW